MHVKLKFRSREGSGCTDGIRNEKIMIEVKDGSRMIKGGRDTECREG